MWSLIVRLLLLLLLLLLHIEQVHDVWQGGCD
jgi:hypothetical protein